MQTRNKHIGEHRTFPATKMLPVETAHSTIFYWLSPATGRRWAEMCRAIKKTHTRRSRQYLKRRLAKFAE